MNSNISSSVRDYYDLLFDNVNFYREIVETQLADLREENTDIQRKLDRNEPDIDRDELSKRLKENADLIDSTTDILQSDAVIKEGISLSAEILYDSEIELSDQFKEAPALEKYDYLLEKFSQDYIADVERTLSDAQKSFSEANTHSENHKSERPTVWENLRSFGLADWKWSESQVALDRQAVVDLKQMRKVSEYAQHNALVSLDAKWAAAKRIDELFPDVSRQRQEEMDREYSSRLENDPIQLYADLVERYSADYVGELGEEHSAVENALETRKNTLDEHTENKPGILANLLSFGEAQKSWHERQAALLKDIAKLQNEENRIWLLRQDAAASVESEAVCKHMKEVMQSKHPELVDMCGIHVQRYWGEINTARLEREKKRKDDRLDDEDKTVRKGVER